MEFIGKFNLNDNPELESMMGHNLKPIKVYYAGNYEQEQVVIEVCHDCYLSDYALVQIVRNEEDLYWNLPAPVWKEDENEVMIMERGNSITSYLKSSSSKEN